MSDMVFYLFASGIVIITLLPVNFFVVLTTVVILVFKFFTPAVK